MSVKGEMEGELTPYLDKISQVGLVDRVILGIDEQGSNANLINVFTKETNTEDYADPLYRDLTMAGARLLRALRRPGILVRMGYVNPSEVDELRTSYSDRGFDLEEIEIASRSLH